MKLEAVHPNDSTKICVASVTRIFDPNYFLVKIDNLISTQDDITDSFVAHKTAPFIFPVGFCLQNGLVLQQPAGTYIISLCKCVTKYSYSDYEKKR